jgi:hypothetical protein
MAKSSQGPYRLIPTLAVQLRLIHSLQHAFVRAAWLRSLLSLASIIGAGTPAFVVPTIVLWTLDTHAGMAAHAFLATSVGLAGFLKTICRLPRPYHVSDAVMRLDPTTETSFGFVSGHAVVCCGVRTTLYRTVCLC